MRPLDQGIPKKLASSLIGALFASLIGHASVAHAQVAQEPLFLGGKAQPNLMFGIDDSWSMAWRYMPDVLDFGSSGKIFGNPWTTGSTSDNGDSGHRWGIAFHPADPSTCDGCTGTSVLRNTFTARALSDGTATDLLSARLRAPVFNTIYYNPEVMYEPWYKADGSKYPNAAPSAAPLHPLTPATTVNLVGNITFSTSTRWCGSNVSATANDLTISNHTGVPSCANLTNEQLAPAVWYEYKGAVNAQGKPTSKTELELASSFTRVRVMDHAQFTRGIDRQDCAAVRVGGNTCTQAEEYQNFANWFTYSRSRMFLSISATTQAFAEFDGGLRLGWGRMHKDGIVEQGVRNLRLTTKSDFYAWLSKMAGTLSSTQLYGSTTANATNGHFFAGGTYIRRATQEAGHYFKEDQPYLVDPDDSSSPMLGCRKNYHLMISDGTEADPNWASFRRIPPNSNTLEGIAKHYYDTDLRTDLANNVPPDNENPATHQHMVNFMVGLGLEVPDMQAAAAASAGRYLSASNVQEFSNTLTSMLKGVVAREGSSASSIAANSTRLDSGTLIYQASFNSADWTGRIRAYKPDQVTGAITEATPVWDTNTTLVRNSTRKIITPSGLTGSGAPLTAAVNFDWGSLSADQRLRLRQLGETSEVNAQKRLAWLRGSAADEGTLLRSRSAVLGDVVNSDPFFVGSTEDFGYAQPNSGLTVASKTAYETFLATTVESGTGKKGRRHMIYVGGNDGMLHGFDANTGAEVFGYVPAAVYANLRDLPQKDYVHRYFVDASPRAQDVFINGSWRTVLVGATGAGGNGVFALDVTNPNNVSLLWEYSGTAAEPMGVAISAPSILRAASGDWLAIFGNGYDMTSGNVKLIAVNLATGALVKAVDTGVSAVGNGLATVAPIDVNGDRITDYVYGGDLRGNLWRFDLLGNNTNGWNAHNRFTATDGTNPQPITTRPDIGRHPDGGVLVYFGTGKYFQSGDNVIGSNPQVQTFYAVRDDDLDIQGNKTPVKVLASNLLTQTIDYEGKLNQVSGGVTDVPVRVVSNKKPATASGAPAAGWRINLVSPVKGAEGERSVSRPILRFGRIIFTTIIPDPDLCGQGGGSWLMELDAITGGRLGYSVLDINNDMLIDDSDFVFVVIDGEQVRVPVSGRYTDEMIKTPGIVDAGEVEFKYTSGSSGTVGVIREKGAGDVLGRQSWRQLQ